MRPRDDGHARFFVKLVRHPVPLRRNTLAFNREIHVSKRYSGVTKAVLLADATTNEIRIEGL